MKPGTDILFILFDNRISIYDKDRFWFYYDFNTRNIEINFSYRQFVRQYL